MAKKSGSLNIFFYKKKNLFIIMFLETCDAQNHKNALFGGKTG
jgi:hypothetical protein